MFSKSQFLFVSKTRKTQVESLNKFEIWKSISTDQFSPVQHKFQNSLENFILSWTNEYLDQDFKKETKTSFDNNQTKPTNQSQNQKKLLKSAPSSPQHIPFEPIPLISSNGMSNSSNCSQGSFSKTPIISVKKRKVEKKEVNAQNNAQEKDKENVRKPNEKENIRKQNEKENVRKQSDQEKTSSEISNDSFNSIISPKKKPNQKVPSKSSRIPKRKKI